MQVEIGNERIGRVVDTYSDIGVDEVCGLFGSTERLEFAANAESAAERLSVESGFPVIVRREK
jgi:S-adenosylmethionine hydrolase